MGLSIPLPIARKVTQYLLLLQPPQPSAQSLLLPQRAGTIRNFDGEDKDFAQRRSCSRDHGSPQPILSQYEGNLLSHAAYQLGSDPSDPRLCRRHSVLRASVCLVCKHIQCTSHLSLGHFTLINYMEHILS